MFIMIISIHDFGACLVIMIGVYGEAGIHHYCKSRHSLIYDGMQLIFIARVS